MSQDLRSFLKFVESEVSREYLPIADQLDGNWELAAITSALQDKMRMPVIHYDNVAGSTMPVVHNVCASLSRIAKSLEVTVAELEIKLEEAYEQLLPPERVESGPVRDMVIRGDDVDLGILPDIRYTATEHSAYLSAAHVVAVDPRSGASNISFHRLMKHGRDSLGIFMTGGGHLDQIFRYNAEHGQDTSVAVFIGAHPLCSLGSLAAGALSLDEYEVIGGLLGSPLAVVDGLLDDNIKVPAASEIALEGWISWQETVDEGPYGEAFGFVSDVTQRPLLRINAMSHRKNPVFQDIVPGKLEHMTMTGVAVQVHLRKTLTEQFDCIQGIYLPTAMTVFIAVRDLAGSAAPAAEILRKILTEQRFVKHAVLFDEDVDISNSKQTQRALSMYVQADRDVLVIEDLPGNGLDPSERFDKTTKWGIDATCLKPGEKPVVRNELPAEVLEKLDISGILDRANAAKKSAG